MNRMASAVMTTYLRIPPGCSHRRGAGGRTVGTGTPTGASICMPPATWLISVLHLLHVPPELDERHDEQEREQDVGEGRGVPHPEVHESLVIDVVGHRRGGAAGTRRPA